MARYNVIDRNTAATFGLKTDGEFNQHALVAMRGEKIDTVVCWGFKRENLQMIADKRNAEMQKMQDKWKASEELDEIAAE